MKTIPHGIHRMKSKIVYKTKNQYLKKNNMKYPNFCQTSKLYLLKCHGINRGIKLLDITNKWVSDLYVNSYFYCDLIN